MFFTNGPRLEKLTIFSETMSKKIVGIETVSSNLEKKPKMIE